MSYSSILNSTLSPKTIKTKNYNTKDKFEYSPRTTTERIENSTRIQTLNPNSKNNKDRKKGVQNYREISIKHDDH